MQRWNLIHLARRDKFRFGGKMHETTFGLNWYLCNNWKVQFQYLNTHRDDVDGAGKVSGFKAIQKDGNVDGFGIRSVLEF